LPGMRQLTVKTFQEMLLLACDAMIAAKTQLCELDGFVGDGDHGVTVERGFLAVKKELQSGSFASISALLEMAGDTLERSMGGAIGPIYGAVFSGAAEKAQGLQAADVCAFAGMLQEGLTQAMLLGGAKPGDRTLIDALSPAVESLCAENGEKDLGEALGRAALKAREGAEATRGMTAKRGRARFLGEKSRGYQDAGATSLSILIQAMADFCRPERFDRNPE
jgi:dihydroxyacetone kinase-like protein